MYLGATARNGRHPLGVISSNADKFINAGTTTEYVTQHLGTHVANTYAKVEKTSTRYAQQRNFSSILLLIHTNEVKVMDQINSREFFNVILLEPTSSVGLY